ncbi:hypothetical protein N1031_19740 [Herbiconiux moechotypicola]|uniref:Alpha-galactosidase NEW3 domain-containing protein n=1 Tax=Herbiconiux moechotypicola TaxID=637393 RepID=A0ABN3E6L0_9MICO|nr:hypothetical protein [Herbiconiux moechotypicola]MCS5731994.1 hypothetical protein [Herbiconiux moechotypicola]
MEPPKQVQRRTVISAAAWSLPVIAVTVGTPLVAASVTEDVVVAITTYPLLYGQQEVTFTVFNDSAYETQGGVTFSIFRRGQTTFTASQVPGGWPTVTERQNPSSLSISGRRMAAGEAYTVTLDANLIPNSVYGAVLEYTLIVNGIMLHSNAVGLDE